MNKILFVENMALANDNPMSTCYDLKCNMVKNDSRFDFYDIGTNEVINTGQYSTVIFGCRSLFLYKTYIKKTQKKIMKQNINLCQIKNKYFIIQDMHKKTYGNINLLCNFLKNNNINIIFTFYNNSEASLIRNSVPGVKHLYLPHHIDTSIFNFLNMPKIYDVLLFGSIHPRHYPFRKRLFEIILKNSDKFRIYHIPKPDNFDPTVCEKGLAKLINMSRICIATKSRYDYLVGKYFEISMCRTLIAGDIPTDGIGIFKNRIIELNNKMSDEEITTKLEYSLKNYDSYSNVMDELYNFVCNNYGLNNYVDKLYKLVV
ncbi:MAG: hypothetical protein Satyrvirus33_9 [Satyrvirus sp.]|uniref:Uncharacterized protein n=1 Tax=Satyrvirus sp. TaxID=2487771 RepID=A0A3G5AJI9_9VIRU|nr:MAG: hypothetical protein Satyrvirus33_9 [Satyrvirus sp.]